MATGAASDAYYDGLEKGLDNETALVRGFLSGAAEVAFEKIGLDNLFKIAGEAGEEGIKSALKRAGLQPVIGSLEEGGTEITNILTDILVSGELSDYKTLIKQYTAQGLSEKDAQAMARRDLAEQVGTAMLAGLVSDAAMGAGAAGYAAYHHEGTYDADTAASQGQEDSSNKSNSTLSQNNKKDNSYSDTAIDLKPQDLMDELANSDVKYNPEEVVAVSKLSDGNLVWLENGDSKAGLNHILLHSSEFATQGITEDQIPNYIVHALQSGRIVGYQGKGTGRPIYEFTYNGVTKRVAITTGSNDYIVGANPVSLK